MIDIRSRVADALRSRLEPRGVVPVKKLAAGINRSPETIRLWLNGSVAVKAEDLVGISRYLRDPSLLGEVFGDLGEEPITVHLWFGECGSHEAPVGHGEFIRRYLGMSPHAAGDLAAYAMRNLGWCELSTTGSSVRLRYHAKGIKAGAAMATRDWLLARAERIVVVSRSVFVGSAWAEAADLDAATVAGELSLAAGAPQQRKVERKRLDLLPANLGSIYRAWSASRCVVMDAAGACGMGGRVNIFATENDSVLCRWIGLTVPVLPRDCIGANVLSWTDPAYGAEVRRAVLEAKAEAATFTELTFPLFGETVHFQRLALDVGSAVVTVTQRREVDAALSRGI